MWFVNILLVMLIVYQLINCIYFSFRKCHQCRLSFFNRFLLVSTFSRLSAAENTLGDREMWQPKESCLHEYLWVSDGLVTQSGIDFYCAVHKMQHSILLSPDKSHYIVYLVVRIILLSLGNRSFFFLDKMWPIYFYVPLTTCMQKFMMIS